MTLHGPVPARSEPHTMLRLLPLLCLLACVAARADAGYGVQPGDLLAISVWNEETMDRDVLVRPDGGLSFPLAGDVMVRGLAVDAIETLIAGRLQRFIPDPVVTVAVREIRGNTVYVLGKVNRPGPYVMSSALDVMQALSLAGGMATFASPGDIRILRRDPGGVLAAIPFDYAQVERGRALEQNILLEAGDVVVVP